MHWFQVTATSPISETSWPGGWSTDHRCFYTLAKHLRRNWLKHDGRGSFRKPIGMELETPTNYFLWATYHVMTSYWCQSYPYFLAAAYMEDCLRSSKSQCHDSTTEPPFFDTRSLSGNIWWKFHDGFGASKLNIGRFQFLGVSNQPLVQKIRWMFFFRTEDSEMFCFVLFTGSLFFLVGEGFKQKLVHKKSTEKQVHQKSLVICCI